MKAAVSLLPGGGGSALLVVCLEEPLSAGKNEAPHLSPAVHCLASLSRLVLPIKWKKLTGTERRGGGEGRTVRRAFLFSIFQ